MIRNKIFYWTCFGFGAGVLWRSFFPFDFYASLFIGAGVVFLVLFFAIAKREVGIFISIFALAFSLGIVRLHLADKPAPEIFEQQVGQKIYLSGIISDEPDKREDGVKLVVEAEDGGAKTKILLSAKKDEDYKYGDLANFTGKLEKPENFLTDQNKEFDYVNYLKKDGVFYTMRYPQIEIVSRGHGSLIKSALYSFKKKLDAGINSAIPAPESSVMGALILGERSSLSQSLRQSFINTGTIHIVTISGYHVTLIAQWIMKILGFLPMNFAIGGGMFAVFLYVIMTGGAQSAVRAGIMASLALLGRATGRIYDAGRALVLAGTVMVFLNPFILAFDVSFQLSFFATVAVVFLAPKTERYLLWIKWKWLRDIAAITAAAYIFVLPFIIYKMGSLSLVALPANIAILPAVPATMILGFLTSFSGLISKILALFPGAIAYALLYYQLAAVEFFSRLSFSSFPVPDFPLAPVILIYAIFLYYLFSQRRAENPAANPNVATDRTSERKINSGLIFLIAAFFVILITAGLISYRHYESNRIAGQNLQALLARTLEENVEESVRAFESGPRTKTSECEIKGPLPDPECTPGAIFEDATVEQICVPGYTKTVRNVSTKLRKEVYAEYGVPYPQPRGAYEVDHLIPLAIGGSNDIANLFLEPAGPAPGFREKDIVEVYLQQEVCGGRVALPAAQRQIATDWLAIYNNLTPEEIKVIKKKYSGW